MRKRGKGTHHYGIYWIMLGSALALVVLFTILAFTLYSNIIAYTILNACISVCGGGFASVIVAFLIELGNNRRIEVKNKKVKDDLLYNIKYELSFLLSYFYDWYMKYADNPEDGNHTWYKWAKMLLSLSDDEINKVVFGNFSKSIGILEELSKKLRDHGYMYVANDILTIREYRGLCCFENDLEELKFWMAKPVERKALGINSILEIKLSIDLIESLKYVNDIMFKDGCDFMMQVTGGTWITPEDVESREKQFQSLDIDPS